MSQYSDFDIVSIKIETEDSSNNKIGDISFSFTNQGTIEVVISPNTNNTMIGGADSSIFIQNKQISLVSNNTDVFVVNGDNNTITIRDYDLNI
jgi:hypothetical protein